MKLFLSSLIAVCFPIISFAQLKEQPLDQAIVKLEQYMHLTGERNQIPNDRSIRSVRQYNNLTRQVSDLKDLIVEDLNAFIYSGPQRGQPGYNESLASNNQFRSRVSGARDLFQMYGDGNEALRSLKEIQQDLQLKN